MATDRPSEIRFASGEARLEALAGVAWLAGAGLALAFGKEFRDLAWIPAAFGVWALWRGLPAWRKPYVLLDHDRVVVFERGKPRHYVPIRAIAAVKRGFNCTRLRLRDGLSLRVSHLAFLNQAEVERFRLELVRRVQTPAP